MQSGTGEVRRISGKYVMVMIRLKYFSSKEHLKSFIQALESINLEFSRINYDFPKLSENIIVFWKKIVKLHCTELYCVEVETVMDNQQNMIKG